MLRWCSFLRNRFNIVISFFLTVFLVASSGYAQSTAPGSVGEASPFPPTLESPEELASVQGLAAPQPAVVETTPTVVAPPVSAAPVTLEPSPSIIAATAQEVQPASSIETASTSSSERRSLSLQQQSRAVLPIPIHQHPQTLQSLSIFNATSFRCCQPGVKSATVVGTQREVSTSRIAIRSWDTSHRIALRTVLSGPTTSRPTRTPRIAKSCLPRNRLLEPSYP